MQNVFIKHPKRSKRQEENDYFGKIKRKKPEIRENDESYLLTCTLIFVEPWRDLTLSRTRETAIYFELIKSTDKQLNPESTNWVWSFILPFRPDVLLLNSETATYIKD